VAKVKEKYIFGHI